MDQTQQSQRSDSFDHNDLYAPIAEWCASPTNGQPSDVTAYCLALDKIVRHPDFDVDELRQVLTANWFDFAEGPGAVEQIEDIVASSNAVRVFLEARGEAAKKPATARLPDSQAIH